MTVIITFTTVGMDAGPFNLYSNLDGYSSAFALGVTRAQLLAGYPSSVVPDGTTIIRAKSFGICTNFVDLPIVPAPPTTTTTSSSTSSTSTTTTSTSSSSTTTTTTTAAPVFNFLIIDCGNSSSYNAVIGGSVLGIGDVISYRPISTPSALPRCGTITSVTFVGTADATITGPNEGISRDCSDVVHCDFS